MSAAKTADTLGALTAEWRTTADVAEALGIGKAQAYARLLRLRKAGKVERNTMQPGARWGRPAVLWRLRAEQAVAS